MGRDHPNAVLEADCLAFRQGGSAKRCAFLDEIERRLAVPVQDGKHGIAEHRPITPRGGRHERGQHLVVPECLAGASEVPSGDHGAIKPLVAGQYKVGPLASLAQRSELACVSPSRFELGVVS